MYPAPKSKSLYAGSWAFPPSGSSKSSAFILEKILSAPNNAILNDVNNLKDSLINDKFLIYCHNGLRPGEKLYEELLIDSESMATSHPLIYRANENHLEYSLLIKKLDLLKQNIEDNNLKDVLKILSILVPEWNAKF